MRYGKILAVMIIVILAILLLFVNKEPIPVRQPSNATLYNNDNRTTDNESINNLFIQENTCEGCHMSGKSSIPQATKIGVHINAGIYCLVCHNFSHDRHPIDKNVTCEKCHEGKNATRPIFTNGSIICNNCHNYPDPLIPSYGNIITIHRPRNVSCIICHADKCTKCHTDIGTNEKWEKRLIHFRTILGTLR